MLELKDLDLRGKRVFLRVDFNVPMDEEGNIIDDGRIIASLPTINYIREGGGMVIIGTHLGRPKGKVIERLSLSPISKRLGELLGGRVKIAPDCVGRETKEMVKRMVERDVLILENLRFHSEEEANDPGFAKELASMVDIYVNDAFACLHRAHTSVVGVPRFVPVRAAGLLLEREIEILETLLTNPSSPFLLLIGGAKPSSKMGVVMNLLDKVDILCAGGMMGYTLLLASGYRMGRFEVDSSTLQTAKEILIRAIRRDLPILLPIDIHVAKSMAPEAPTKLVFRSCVTDGYEGVDIGPITLKEFTEAILKAKTIFWNGPLGYYESERFSKGTEEVANALVKSSATKIVGGGDTIAAIKRVGQDIIRGIDHISTGGGAALEFLAGKELPGLVSLEEEV
jgi:phosphoglycerate kinase